MGKLLVVTVLFCAGLGLNQTANAGVMLEPFVGYGMGSSKQGDNNFKDSGAAYGARIAYSQMGFFVGGEYQGGSITSKPTSGSSTTLNITDLGATVGYEFPILLRVFGTYFFSAEGKLDNGKIKGSGMKVGVGYTAFPLVAFNLEYHTTTYTKGEAGGVSGDLTEKISGNLVMLSVSVPFTF